MPREYTPFQQFTKDLVVPPWAPEFVGEGYDIADKFLHEEAYPRIKRGVGPLHRSLLGGREWIDPHRPPMPDLEPLVPQFGGPEPLDEGIGEELLGERGDPYEDIADQRMVYDMLTRRGPSEQHPEYGGPEDYFPGRRHPSREFSNLRASPEIMSRSRRAGLPPVPHEYSPMMEKLLARKTPGYWRKERIGVGSAGEPGGPGPSLLDSGGPQPVSSGDLSRLLEYINNAHPSNRGERAGAEDVPLILEGPSPGEDEELVLINEPTRGLDVGAKQEMFRRMGWDEINPYAPGYDEGTARDRRLRDSYEQAVREYDEEISREAIMPPGEYESIQEMMGKRRY